MLSVSQIHCVCQSHFVGIRDFGFVGALQFWEVVLEVYGQKVRLVELVGKVACRPGLAELPWLGSLVKLREFAEVGGNGKGRALPLSELAHVLCFNGGLNAVFPPGSFSLNLQSWV